MKYCSHCGKEIMDEAIICPSCGCSVNDKLKSASGTEKKPFYKKWWFWVIIAFVLIGIIAGFIGNNGDSEEESSDVSVISLDESQDTTNTESEKETETTKKPKTTKQTKSQSTTSKVTKAKKTTESSATTVSKYEQIYNEYAKKIRDAAPTSGISELAEISNEGIQKMAEYMLKAKGTDGQYETYEKWAGKLMDVYLSEAK